MTTALPSPSDQLAEGAAYIREHGHTKRVLGNRARGDAVCLIGSLPTQSARLEAVIGTGPFHQYLADAIRDLHGFDLDYACAGTWNDLESTTPQMAVEVLEYASKLAFSDEASRPDIRFIGSQQEMA